MTLVQLETRVNDARQIENHAAAIVGATRDELDERGQQIDFVARHLHHGTTVSPVDRHNIGTVTRLHDHDGTADVTFTSRSGHHATKTFSWDQLRIVRPDETPTRTLTTAAQNTLDLTLQALDKTLVRFDQVLTAHGLQPNEADVYQAAATRSVQSEAARLTAQQPTWLIALVGNRPTNVPGAGTWEETVTRIATWRLRHQFAPSTEGIGPAPQDLEIRNEWTQLRSDIVDARQWLVTNDRLTPGIAETRTTPELVQRRDHLDAILDAAPADTRRLLRQLTNGQLNLDDTAAAIEAATQNQVDRRNWIIEHWPHIVERHEIDAASADRHSASNATEMNFEID